MSSSRHSVAVLVCLAVAVGVYADGIPAPRRSLKCVIKADVVHGVDVMKSACLHYEGAAYASQKTLVFQDVVSDINSASALCNDNDKSRDGFISEIYRSYVHEDVKDGDRVFTGQAKNINEVVSLPVFRGYLTNASGWPSHERCASVSSAGRLSLSMTGLGAVLAVLSLVDITRS